MTQTTISEWFSDDHGRLDELFKQFQALKKSDLNKSQELYREFKTGLEHHNCLGGGHSLSAPSAPMTTASQNL